MRNQSKKRDLKKFKLNEGLAEVYGALLGDGCLSQYFSNYDKRERYILLLTGHTHDGLYYKNTIRPIFFKEFGINGYIYFRKKYNVVYFRTMSKRIFSFFKERGFPVGKKYNSLRIPNIIFFDDKLSIACIRGIFDTDGSIYRRYSKQYKNHAKFYKNYHVIQFKLISHKIIEQIKDILNRIGIKTTKIGVYKNSLVLRITDQKEIHKFMKLIKPNNNWHIERYLKT